MSIKEYFRGREIFITGGSGFLGKAIIEKIIRSCPDFGRIFVLIRSKKGKDENERLEELLQQKFFERARKENAAGFQKIEAIAGDCAEIGLGIKNDDLKRLKNVQIIYHSAASVRFDDPLGEAILLNTRGTWELLKIAETLKNLQAFLHISTTYCNADRAVVEEQVYKPTVNWLEAIKMAEQMDKNILDILSTKYIDLKPNNYTFTKALAEQVVDDYKQKVPVAIFRPAIVSCCLDDPIPGWIDNFNGQIGMLTACGIGIQRVHNSNGKCLQPIVPIDIVVRGLLVATYKRGLDTSKKDNSKSKTIEVYNCSIDKISPINMTQIVDLGRLNISKNPFEKTLWYPDGSFHACPVLFYLKLFMVQLMLSAVLDVLLKFKGRKPMFFMLQRKIRAAWKALHTFVTEEWDFKVVKFFELDKLVPITEHKDFAFLEKSRDIDFYAYICEGIKGSKEFLLHENPVSSPEARKRFEIMKKANNIVAIIFYLLIARFLFNFFYSWMFK